MSSTSAAVDDSIVLEEVQKALTEIESKYTLPTPVNPMFHNFKETLIILSKEFDSVGIPPINLGEPSTKIFKQVVNNARSLIHLYRKTITQIKDVNIEKRLKDSQSNDLYQKIEDYKENLKRHKEQIANLQLEINILNSGKKDFLKKESNFRNELEKTKRYYLVKQNELERNAKRLLQENEKLKEQFGKYIGTNSSSEIALTLLREWNMKEEFYKSTIQQLQDNNKELIEEVLNLKEEILLQKEKY